VATATSNATAATLKSLMATLERMARKTTSVRAAKMTTAKK
jgi:hypothetical protein